VPLKLLYTAKEDWEGRAYVGFDIQQDRDKGTVTLSMPRYIDDAAERFGVDTSHLPKEGGMVKRQLKPPVSSRRRGADHWRVIVLRQGH
jgi:hypothetical protein